MEGETLCAFGAAEVPSLTLRYSKKWVGNSALGRLTTGLAISPGESLCRYTPSICASSSSATASAPGLRSLA
eukprot:2110668-Prymnesium_polylepis.3